MKIYISSTYEDLKEYRRAVIDAIEKLGHEPIAVESFGADTESPLLVAFNNISRSNAFIGIYAHRYGAVRQNENRSFTELEYNKARELELPCFIYLLDPNYPWPPKFVDRGQAKKRLDAFLAKITKTNLYGTFTSPTDLVRQIVEDLGHKIALASLHSIPAPPADFVGRASEVAQLLRDLESGTRVAISGLAGMGGVGKTALALVVAHELAPQYPDAQIMLDLKGTTGSPLTPSDLIRHVIHAFEPQADLQQKSGDELSAIYRTLLTGKRALLLLDNAANATQVKPLLPPPTCALLITSRRYFTLPGLQPFRLDVMPPTDATVLLRRLCSRIADSAEEIASLCGYLPLALRIAGSTLAEHVDLSPKEYAARLQDRSARPALLKSDDDPALSVETAFELSYELLSSEMQARWCALHVFPTTFDVSAAADVWKMETDATRALLSDLVRFNLLHFVPLPSQEEGSSQGRYYLHDLLSSFAESRSNHAERTTAHLRHAQYYLNVVRTANGLYLKGGENVLRGLQLFDAEFAQIQAGQAWAAENYKTSEEAAQLCNEYPNAATDFLDLRLSASERINWLSAAVVAAQEMNNMRSVGKHLSNLGIAYADLGDERKAIRYLEQALVLAREIGDKRSEGMQFGNLGIVQRDRGNVRQATDYFEHALRVAREIGDKRSEGNWLGNLGTAYVDLGAVQQALPYYEQALAIAREIEDRRNESTWLARLGVAHANLGNVQQALLCYEQALSITRETGDKPSEAKWLGDLANAYDNVGNSPQITAYLEQVLALARNIGNRQLEGIALESLSGAYEKSGEIQRAIEFIQAALQIFVQIDSPLTGRARRQLELLESAHYGGPTRIFD